MFIGQGTQGEVIGKFQKMIYDNLIVEANDVTNKGTFCK